MQPPRTPGPPSGSSGNRPNNYSGPRTPNNSSNNSSQGGASRSYGNNSGAPSGAAGGAPRTGYQGNNPNPNYKGSNPRPAGSGYQGSGGGYQGGAPRPYTPRPAGSFAGGPRPFTPRGSGFVKEKSKDDLRINAEITVPNVRLVGEDGEMVGVVDIKEALRLADEAGLDLVEISPQAEPPVCKIIDYGKYKYEQEKKNAEAKKKQKVVEIKELKLRPTIGINDYNIKLKHAKEFIEEGDKVKFTLRFKGREQSHADLGFAVFTRLKEDLAGLVKIDQEPKFEGRQVIMVVSPAKA